ncbi:MAG: peptidoglycan-binding domain-containing protein [Paracoccaceae bacterium]|nr:peptidoglycan-binding domain-containing protein [Paracoccaceae bacterium]
MMNIKTGKRFGLVLFVSSIFLIALSGCATINPSLAPKVAHPRTPPARNFTSFNDTLRCMDNMLARAGRKTVLISSSGIPDLTSKIRVGADDMLVNAVNQMNVYSKSYVFIDQPLERRDAQIVWLTKREGDLTPQFYIRGSISQLDEGVVKDSFSFGINNDLAPNRDVDSGSNRFSRRLSVVTVDLHLVSYPDRKIIPGGSVANSMVIVGDGFGAGLTGIIDLSEIGVTIGMERIESVGQAVRNLVELGAIELLGKHSRLPYWNCLSLPTVKTERKGVKEVAAAALGATPIISKAQTLLSELGYYHGTVSGNRDKATRLAIAQFQSDEGLIASGEADYDLLRRLREKQVVLNQVKEKLRAQRQAAAKLNETVAEPVASEIKAMAVHSAPLCPEGHILSQNECVTENNILAGYLK